MAAESGGNEETLQSEFNANLKQFIASLEPALKEAGSLAAAEDYLTHLEATDENFHRYLWDTMLYLVIAQYSIPPIEGPIHKLFKDSKIF